MDRYPYLRVCCQSLDETSVILAFAAPVLVVPTSRSLSSRFSHRDKNGGAVERGLGFQGRIYIRYHFTGWQSIET